MAAKFRVDSKKRYKHGACKSKVRKDYNSRRNERRKDERLKGRLGKDPGTSQERGLAELQVF